MSREKTKYTFAYVKEGYTSFFERVMVLYNLKLSKNEKRYGIDEVRNFVVELVEAGAIINHLAKGISRSIDEYSFIVSNEKTIDEGTLEFYSANLSFVREAVNAAIGEMIH
ncbi:MAG: hypothetical protein J6X50_00130 [Bacilli bacterium]|nr:hypothetical protein [Bacilli bacterium]